MAPRIWIEPKDHSVEGHVNNASLYFNNNLLWGPRGAHDNSVDIQTALRQADPRLELRLERKPHSVEGHTRKLFIEVDGNLLLNGLSVHDNMEGMVTAINTVWTVSPPA